MTGGFAALRHHPSQLADDVVPLWGFWERVFEAKDLRGSFDMKRLAQFFTPMEWWRLRPDPDPTGAPTRTAPHDIVLAAQSEAGDLAVIYLPTGGDLVVALERLAADPQTEWFNPRNGQRSPALQMSPGRFVASDDQDWGLLVRREDDGVRELQRRNL
jgi:hypothetical protein